MNNDESAQDNDDHIWPEALLASEAVRTWIASALPGQPRVVGPLLVHQAKAWGVTASFVAAGSTPERSREVVFKASLLPLFARAPHIYALLTERCPGTTPELLAWTSPHPGQTWSLFSPFEGETIEEEHTLDALLAMARTLADIQSTFARLPEQQQATLPRMSIEDLPAWFERVLRDLRERQAPLWRGNAHDLAAQFGLPDDPADQLATFRPQVSAWSHALLAANIPQSLDHVDLHWGNAIQQPNNAVLIYDWEEATLSCPLFSLDRLLNDARELDLGEEAAWSSYTNRPLYTPSELALRNAYLHALPWGVRSDRARAFELAMLLAPIKTAHESLIFADALGWGNEPSLAAAWSVSRMLARWPAASS
jgi:hypothetical protein